MTFIYTYINHHKPIGWASFLAHKDADFALAPESIDLHPEFSGSFRSGPLRSQCHGGSVPSSKYEENGRHPTDNKPILGE